MRPSRSCADACYSDVQGPGNHDMAAFTYKQGINRTAAGTGEGIIQEPELVVVIRDCVGNCICQTSALIVLSFSAMIVVERTIRLFRDWRSCRPLDKKYVRLLLLRAFPWRIALQLSRKPSLSFHEDRNSHWLVMAY